MQKVNNKACGIFTVIIESGGFSRTLGVVKDSI